MYMFDPSDCDNVGMVFHIQDHDLKTMSLSKSRLTEWVTATAHEIASRYKEFAIDKISNDLKKAYEVGRFSALIQETSIQMLCKSIQGLDRT